MILDTSSVVGLKKLRLVVKNSVHFSYYFLLVIAIISFLSICFLINHYCLVNHYCREVVFDFTLVINLQHYII